MCANISRGTFQRDAQVCEDENSRASQRCYFIFSIYGYEQVKCLQCVKIKNNKMKYIKKLNCIIITSNYYHSPSRFVEVEVGVQKLST